MAREQDLYDLIKGFLEGQGYEVKSEIGACDIVAMRGDEPPLIVEMKSHFNLDLVLQAVDRLSLAPTVYVAFPDAKGNIWRRQRKRVSRLCRMLGVGILLVRDQRVYAALDPLPYRPRTNTKRATRLLKEFTERVGDPNTGGVTRTKIITAYRQDALRILYVLSRTTGQANGHTNEQPAGQSPAALRRLCGVERTGAVLLANHYGWFERIRRGFYGVSPKGYQALESYADVLATLTADLPGQSPP